MKNIILILLFFSALNSYSQTKSQFLDDTRVAGVRCTYIRTINPGDTSLNIDLMFKNAEYPDDYKVAKISFVVGDSSGVISFVKDLSSSIKEANSNSKMEWKRKIYAFSTPGNGEIKLDAYGKFIGYTILKKDDAQKILDWFIVNGFKP